MNRKRIRVHFRKGFYIYFDLMQQAYNLDRESPPVTGTAEEISTSDKIKLANSILIENTTHANVCAIEGERVPYYNHGEVIKSILAYNTSTQSTTIERLTKALEEISGFEYPHSSIEKAMIIAREALKSIKK